MFKKAEPFFIRTITSTHVGSGSDLGVVDLPIQREKHTSFPKIESSSLKGSLREAFENLTDAEKIILLNNFETENFKNGAINKAEFKEHNKDVMNFDFGIHLTFGYDEDIFYKIPDKNKRDKAISELKNQFGKYTEFSGCLAFTDARLLLFPVKSIKGVFAWITCPMILKRFNEDLKLVNNQIKSEETEKDLEINFKEIEIGKCIVTKQCGVKIKCKDKYSVVLEEYTFEVEAELEKLNHTTKIPYIEGLEEKLVILSDDDFKDFVNLSTEVITRTKIDNATGTVKQGALFNEEYLPPETIMYYLVFASPVFQKEDNKKGVFKSNGKDEAKLVFDFFEKGLPEFVQIGGNATLGKGICRMKFDNGSAELSNKEVKKNG